MSDSLLRYQQDIRRFSDELIRIQAPIKILDSIKWPKQIEDDFLAKQTKQLPNISNDFYQTIPLTFNAAQTQTDLQGLKNAIDQGSAPSVATEPIGARLLNSLPPADHLAQSHFLPIHA